MATTARHRHIYGPHRPEDAPTVIDARTTGGHIPDSRPPARAILRQRAQLNTIAHRAGRPDRGLCRVCSRVEADCLALRPGVDDDHDFEPRR